MSEFQFGYIQFIYNFTLCNDCNVNFIVYIRIVDELKHPSHCMKIRYKKKRSENNKYIFESNYEILQTNCTLNIIIIDNIYSLISTNKSRWW